MTFKTLLTHVEPDWGSGSALTAAVELAERFGAHLIGLGAEAFDPVSYAFTDGDIIQMLRDQIDLDAKSAERRFRTATASLGAASSWLTSMDTPALAMASVARGADLVVARRTHNEAGSNNLCRSEALVVGVGAPVLVVADSGSAPKASRVLVAWRDGHHARRALVDALPFLTAAEEVRLCEISPPAEQIERQRLLLLVCERLARLGVKANAQVIARTSTTVAVQLERTAEAMGADLIVAGAYSHRRMQEWVLGGVTHDLLLGSFCHILFSH